jgi:hypothetical protein
MSEPQGAPIPDWLNAKVEEHLTALEPALRGAALQSIGFCMTPLTEPPEGVDFDYWDRCCDRCGKHCPDEFFTGAIQRRRHGVLVMVAFGVCPEHKP